MVFCTSCGNKCLDGARFCNGCGAALLTPQTQQSAAAPSFGSSSSSSSSSVASAPRVSPRSGSSSPRPSATPNICPYCHRECNDVLDKIVGTQKYHLDCFSCNQCKQHISTGDRFFRDPREAGLLLCASCKDQVYSTPAPAKAPAEQLGEKGYTIKRPTLQPSGDWSVPQTDGPKF